MKQYWVTGGLYSDTNFTQLAPGQEAVRKGPFDSYEAAQKVWQSLAWENVDDCQAYFTIEDETLPDAPQYWVVGGHYDADQGTSQDEKRYGPYQDYEVAKKEWQRLAWETVDEADARFRIETIAPQAPVQDQRLAYRLLTGADDKQFCARISQALADGYVLYGSPSMTCRPDGQVMVAQAVVLP